MTSPSCARRGRTATDAARENLIAVENQIRELNEALGAIGPGVAPLETDPALLAESAAPPEHPSRPTAEAPPRRRSRRSPRWPPRTRALNRAARMTICSRMSVTHPDIGEDDPMLAGLPLESGCTCRASSPTCTAIWMNGA